MLAGVGVRVEVDHREPSVAEMLGQGGDVGLRDGVVAAEHHGDLAGRGHGEHRRLQVGQRQRGLGGRHQHIAGVHDAEVQQRVDPQRQVRPGAGVLGVVAGTQGQRTHPGAGPVGGSGVVGGTDDHRARVGVARRVVQIAAGHPGERDVRPVHPTKSGHAAIVPLFGVQRTTPRFGQRISLLLTPDCNGFPCATASELP